MSAEIFDFGEAIIDDCMNIERDGMKSAIHKARRIHVSRADLPVHISEMGAKICGAALYGIEAWGVRATKYHDADVFIDPLWCLANRVQELCAGFFRDQCAVRYRCEQNEGCSGCPGNFRPFDGVSERGNLKIDCILVAGFEEFSKVDVIKPWSTIHIHCSNSVRDHYSLLALQDSAKSEALVVR